MIGIVMSCALVIFLSALQFRRIMRSRDMATRLLVFTTAVIIVICAVLRLPAANAYDKLPFLLFFPLAAVGGWTIAEFSERASTSRGRVFRYVLVCVLAFAPLNIFMLAAYYNTTPVPVLDTNEETVAAWVRSATPRESVVFDTNRRSFLLIAGPRRYYIGSEFYADSWGYDRKEIDKRMAIKNDIYSPGDLEPLTLETLGEMPAPVYIVVRRNDSTVDAAKFDQRSPFFRRVFTSGPIAVFEVDRGACLSAGRGDPSG
jgi:hypothetical protein